VAKREFAVARMTGRSQRKPSPKGGGRRGDTWTSFATAGGVEIRQALASCRGRPACREKKEGRRKKKKERKKGKGGMKVIVADTSLRNLVSFMHSASGTELLAERRGGVGLRKEKKKGGEEVRDGKRNRSPTAARGE